MPASHHQLLLDENGQGMSASGPQVINKIIFVTLHIKQNKIHKFVFQKHYIRYHDLILLIHLYELRFDIIA